VGKNSRSSHAKGVAPHVIIPTPKAGEACAESDQADLDVPTRT